MRQEAKHEGFKKLASITGNFINIGWTLAKRYEKLRSNLHFVDNSVMEENTFLPCFQKFNQLLTLYENSA